MIRFRNPGTEYSTQIQVIKELYHSLKNQSFFSLDDMAIVIAKSRLMTAYGYAGDQAIELSNTDQESLNSAKMNAKMYAEVFRMLGWVAPYSENTSYPLTFTYLGIHIALSEDDNSKLYEQCVLGINNPTQLTDKMSYCEKVRFFKCALRSLIDLGGIMYKHELCLGPMSIDDQDEYQYKNMIRKIQSIRGSDKRLKESFKNLAVELGMKETPVDNCTRLPIAFMKSCGWIELVSDNTLYNVRKRCIRITEHGREVYESIKNMADIRLSDFEQENEDVKDSLIRLGLYRMLERSGYDLSKVKNMMDLDLEKCRGLIGGKDILFSPCQTIKRNRVEKALNVSIGGNDVSKESVKTFASTVSRRNAKYIVSELHLNVQNKVNLSLLNEAEDITFLKIVSDLNSKKFTSHEIVEKLFKIYIDSTQTVFYPLIATLFKIMGFKCNFSRAGDNGSRWDAIIDDPLKSIPIEIKSPTEELHLSVKAIRQALENKIVLLSRNTFVTDINTVSLAVGYYLPNERAEVADLILNIKKTYGYKIGVIDFKSLLSIAISILVDNKGVNKDDIYNWEGLINANI